MIEKLVYKEVEIEAPDNVEHFLLMKREINKTKFEKWMAWDSALDPESLKQSLDYHLKSDEGYREDRKFEYKTYSIMLPY